MTRPIPLRDDYRAEDLRELACKTHDARQARRLLTIAGVYAGLSVEPRPPNKAP